MIANNIAGNNQTPAPHGLSEAMRPDHAALLGRLNAALRDDTPLEEIVGLALRELGEMLGASRCLLYAPTPRVSHYIAVAEWTSPGQATMNGQRMPIPAEAVDRNRLNQQAFAIADTALFEQHEQNSSALIQLFNVRAIVGANLLHASQQLGVLEVHCAAPRLWTPDEQALVQRAADYLAIARHQHALARQHAQENALQNAIAAIATTCATLLDQEAALTFILDQLASFVRFDSASVWLLRDDLYGTIAASRGFDHSISGTVMYLGPGTINWRSIEARAPIRVADFSGVSGWHHTPGYELIRSWLCVPLILNDSVVGQLTIDSHTPDGFNEEDEQIAQAFADQVAASVHRVRLYTEARRRADQLQLLHQASAEISTLRDADAVVNAVGRLLHDIFGYYQVTLGLVEDGVMRFNVMRGNINDIAEVAAEYRTYDLSHYPRSCGVTGWAVVNRKSLLANDVYSTEHYVFNPAFASTRAALAVPILGAAGALGVIDVESDQEGAFDRHDQELLETLAGHVAATLEHIRGLDTERRLNADLRAAYQQLQQAQDQLVRTEQLRVLGELASGVAHDFNNMLAGILGHTQLLLLDATDSELRAGLTVIERATLDGAAAVRRLQEFAHIRESVREPVDMHRVVEESLAVTRPRWRDTLQEQGVGIEVVREAQPLPLLTGDSAALRDLVTNLILNALDAMPQGGTLRLVTRPTSGLDDATADNEAFSALPAPAYSGPAVLLEVGDSGVGIEPALLRRIFDPFFTTKGRRGTGLGLAIAQGIVQRHGGSISVRSRPGSGSTFVVHLPATEDLSDDLADTMPPSVQLERTAVLVVEDDTAVRNALVQLLGRWGCLVTAVTSGHDAVTLLDEPGGPARFQLLCTDLGLPGMSGWELLASVRARAPALPTILITGWGQQLNATEARARGADYLLAKPFDASALRRAVGAALTHTERSS
jgi:signal transduction histidine kinase/CheY-like chemotaxis protein